VKKLVIISKFLYGELSDQAAQTLGLEKAIFALRKCRNMIIDKLSGVRNRKGTKYLQNIASVSRLIQFTYNGKEGIMLLTPSKIESCYGDALAIDKNYTFGGNLSLMRYDQWKNYIIITIPTQDPIIITLGTTTTIQTLTNQCSPDAKPTWEANSSVTPPILEAPNPIDVVFHVDRFVFCNESTLFGANSENTADYEAYEFREAFEAVQVYDLNGEDEVLKKEYYSAVSSFRASPLGGSGSGFQWIVSGRYILGGSARGLWVLSDPEGIMSPDHLFIKNVSAQGTNNVPAIPKDGGFLYFQADGKTFCFFEYVQGDPLITALNNSSLHLFEEHKPTMMIYTMSPDYIVWILREDGKIVTYQQDLETKTYAWSLLEFSGEVQDIAFNRVDGEDKILLKMLENGETTLLEMSTDSEYMDSYVLKERDTHNNGGTDYYDYVWTETYARFANKTVSLVALDEKQTVRLDKEVDYIAKVDDEGNYRIPEEYVGKFMFVGTREWLNSRVVQDGGKITIPAGDIDRNNPDYIGFSLYIFNTFNNGADYGTKTIRSYEEVTADSGGKITLPEHINKAYIGLDYESYIEPRVFSEIHREKKGRVISIAPILNKTNGYSYGGTLDKMQRVTLNDEDGTTFSGQSDKMSVVAPKSYMPSVVVKASKCSNLHIASIYAEVE